MKSLFIALLFVSLGYALSELQYQDSFRAWTRLHDKSYNHDEFLYKYNIFKKNLDFINEHNANPYNHRVALNKFADLTAQEFAAMYTGLSKPSSSLNAEPFVPKKVDLPDSFDWRTQGAVTPVKDQGQCGSCWAFSATGALEGCHQIQTGTLTSLSEKNLMDCSWSQGNQGCNGGLMTSSFDYVISNGGIDTEASYPYSPVSSHNCRFTTANIGSTLSTYKNVQRGSEDDLQQCVHTGPTSVAIDAGQSSFQFYHSGVYYEPYCSSSQLNHGVLAVGWGSENGNDYWIVKNSWGTSWGNQGYILMSRNRNNNCGIATMATIPSGCSN